MANRNPNKFQKYLFSLLKKQFDFVSTIDHPFASPPVRLIDGHHKLKQIAEKGQIPLICICDANILNVRDYRYNFVFDLGILSLHDEHFWIFRKDMLYPCQRPRMINFEEIRKLFIKLSEQISNTPKKEKTKQLDFFLQNLDTLVSIYKRTIKEAKNGTEFYLKLVKELYELLDIHELFDFLNLYSVSYFFSGITSKWIPFCIKETLRKPFGFLALLDKEVFKKPYFRNIDPTVINSKYSDKKYVQENLREIIGLLEEKKIIPSSLELFYWTLYLAEFQHYGNDRGFFEKLNTVLPPKKIQMTVHNQDSINIIQCKNTITYSPITMDDERRFQKCEGVKASRMCSITSIYCKTGKNLSNLIKNAHEQEKTVLI